MKIIPPLSLKKLELEQLEVLQNELYYYRGHIYLTNLSENFLTAIMCFDIANKLVFMMQRKYIDAEKKKHYTLKLTVSEAALIQKMITEYFDKKQCDNLYAKHSIQKFREKIDYHFRNAVN